VVRELAPEARAKDRQDQIAAGLLARCVPLAAEDKKLPEPKGKELAKIYAELAITLLRQAVASGFQDAAFLRTSEDFQALREREEFQKILKELPSKK